jgi:heterodisulfide reductase subunit B
MKFTYYPGCSLKGTARDYAESISALCDFLNIELDEIPDWNCCGATAAHSINQQAGLALAARTLTLAAKMSQGEMLVPCPMCFNRLKTVAHVLQQDQNNRFGLTLPDPVPILWDLANFFFRRKDAGNRGPENPKAPGGIKGSLLLRVHGQPTPGDHRCLRF